MRYVLNICIAAFALATLLGNHSAGARTNSEIISRNLAHMEMFMTGQYKDLDREMNQIQAEFQKGQWDDVDLVTLMQSPFMTTESTFEEKYTAWLAEYPKSYAAHQVRAFYYANMAAKSLNGHRPDQSSPQELSEVKRYIGLAVADDAAALKLAAKPFATYYSLIYLYALTGKWDKSREMLDEADKIAPKNTAARNQYLFTLSRFGRPLAEISDFVDQVRKSGIDRKYIGNYENILHSRLLNEGQFDQLDVEMNQAQQDYEAGKIDDRSLDSYFGIFADTNPTLEAVYNAWVEVHPKSYAARQARARFYSEVAIKARGGNYSKDTSDQEMSGMAHYMKLAFDDDQAAMALTAKPILAIDNIMLIGQFGGADVSSGQMLALANKIDPKNDIVRYSYMHGLQTRWGGSLEEMEKFLGDVKAAGLSEDNIKDFEDMIITEKLWLANRKATEYENIGKLQTGF